MKTIKEIIFPILYEENNVGQIRYINLPRFYNLNDMLDAIEEFNKMGGAIDNTSITFIATTLEGYRTSILKGFHTYYLYDMLDFTDTFYYIKGSKTTVNTKVIIESTDMITKDLVTKIFDTLPPYSTLYAIYDSVIPRRYKTDNDELLHYRSDKGYVEKIKGDKRLLSSNINNLLNKIRTHNMNLPKILVNDFDNGNVVMKEISMIKLSDILDLSIPIITPHITLIKDLNNEIRDYLNINGNKVERTYLPHNDEWLVTHGPSECYCVETQQTYCLPIGYRFKCKRSNVHEGVCEVFFDLERPDGNIYECSINCAVPYFEYLSTGDTTIQHTPGTFKVYYGYVIPSYTSTDNSYDDIMVIYDPNVDNVKEDLYTAILPARRKVTIYYGSKMILNNIHY